MQNDYTMKTMTVHCHKYTCNGEWSIIIEKIIILMFCESKVCFNLWIYPYCFPKKYIAKINCFIIKIYTYSMFFIFCLISIYEKIIYTTYDALTYSTTTHISSHHLYLYMINCVENLKYTLSLQSTHSKTCWPTV